MGVRGPKSSYGNPLKGTKRYKIIQLMLRPEGTNSKELIEVGLLKSSHDLYTIMNDLRDFFGFDIKIISQKRSNFGPKPINQVAIVGRESWDGKYQSWIDTCISILETQEPKEENVSETS